MLKYFPVMYNERFAKLIRGMPPPPLIKSCKPVSLQFETCSRLVSTADKGLEISENLPVAGLSTLL